MNGTNEAREGSREWLLLKIAECMVEPMSERTAERLSAYSGAYNAICQWENGKPSYSNSAKPFTQEEAKEWTSAMQNVDGTTGPHWTLEQTNQIMTQRGINCDPAEFYAAMNMVYSDYSKVAKKLNVSNIDFYAEIAKAFLDDQDAAPDKLARYYEFVVKH